jgi:hypothetical protein
MNNGGSKGMVFLAGVLVGFVVLLVAGRVAESPATAQPAVKDARPRFSITSCATKDVPFAFVVDSETGDVFQIDQRDKPVYLGRAEKK